jgi:hypothetical protein
VSTSAFAARMSADTRRVETRLTALRSSVAAATASISRLAGVFGVGLGAGTFIRGIRDAVADVARLADVADKVGLTTEQLQELTFAAEQSGVEAGTAEMAFQRFSRRIAEAAAGVGVLKPVLDANNIALRDAEGNLRSNRELLAEYADLIKNAASEQDKLRLAFLGFDSEGAALVNTLRDGSKGLDDMAARARDLGVVIKDETVRAAAELDDKWQELGKTISTRFKADVVGAIENLRSLTTELSLAERAARFLQQTFGELETAEERARGAARARKPGLTRIRRPRRFSRGARGRPGPASDAGRTADQHPGRQPRRWPIIRRRRGVEERSPLRRRRARARHRGRPLLRRDHLRRLLVDHPVD